MTITETTSEQSMLDKAVEKYIWHRNQITKINKEMKTQLDAHKQEMEKLRIAFLRKLDSVGARSMATEHGTIVSNTSETPTCGDWDAFYRWMVEHNRPDLLQKRLAPQQFKEDIERWIEEAKAKLPAGEELDLSTILPPGITIIKEREISIRKA